MASTSKKEGGSKEPEEEKLNIPSFVRITNTSGFFIPASIINRVWIALSYQIANRSETVVRTVDNNFIAYFWNHVLGMVPASPATEDTMTSFADKVYAANIGKNFTTCTIPDVFWQQTGYHATRLEKKMGEKEGYLDLRIWVEGFDNESLSASHRLTSSNLSTIPYINIGTTFGQTVWSTDFIFQRMKAHNEAITKVFTKDPEALEIEHDSIDTLCCKASIDGEAPIISPTHDDLHEFAKDNHRFLIQTCLNNDTKDCVTSMQDFNSKFPNFNNVSKLYYGLEVIPISSQGFSRLEPVMAITKRPKAKAAKSKRRKAKRKIDGVEQTGEASSVATVQTEITEISYETLKAEKTFGVFTEENVIESTTDGTSTVTHMLGETATEITEARTTEPINTEEGIVTNQHQANLHVAMTNHGQKYSQFTAQSDGHAGQPIQGQTILQVSTLAKDTPVSVTALASDAAISVTTLAADAPISATAIAGTGTRSTKNAASPQTAVKARDAASSQPAAPTRGTSLPQTAAKARDAASSQPSAPTRGTALPQTAAKAKDAASSQPTVLTRTAAKARDAASSQPTAPTRGAALPQTAIPTRATALPQTAAKAKDAASSQPAAPTRGTSLTQTAIPTRATALPQTAAKAKDAASSQPAAPMRGTALPHTAAPTRATSLPHTAAKARDAASSQPAAPTRGTAIPQTAAEARDTAASQTAAPTGTSSSSQTPAKVAVALRAAAPVEAQVISQAITPVSTSSNHTGAQTAPNHGSQSTSEDRARVIAELRAQPPPPSLEEARARRASIKEERRQNIEFIRKRTTSRASALALSMASTAPSGLSQLPQPSGPLSDTTTQGNATTNQSMNLPRVLEQVPELALDSAANEGQTSDLTATGPRFGLASPVAQENVKPKRGKWIAPLPEHQSWGTTLSASSVPEKKKKQKNRRNVNPVRPSVVSVGTQTGTGVTSCSVGTQTEIGVATSIAEDLVPGAGPVPSREDESVGHGNTKPPPSVTSRASLQRELELTSIVEDSALEQDCGGEYARGILTMATPSTAHSNLVAELTGAGVPSSALTSLSRSGLEAHEATGCRQPLVGIHLEVETVTIGGVTFEARRRGSRHRIAASMPRLELDW
ncbi:hypothetical protein V502_06510 [Pseudogymnoascus sp. VKM F-4520 (FW-2644)]|nr:hypothetical protein V502_06510 [Pseudogymnoascus sp. VKM F-4520 (FW-2644)]